MNNIDQEKWTTVISSKRGWFDINLREVWQYRDLIQLFFRRDFVASYKQTVLGPLWYFLHPLFSTAIYTVVFGMIAGLPTDGAPQILFYLSGTMIWAYFATCVNATGNSFQNNSSIWSKVYFPRLVTPIAVAISNMIILAIQLLFFLLILGGFAINGLNVKLTWWVLVTPLLVLQTACLAIGCGLTLSSLT